MSIKSLSIGIIDFLAVMIPGTIWIGIFFGLHALNPDFLRYEFDTISAQLYQLFPGSTNAINTSILIFCCYLTGYISRLIPPRVLDRLTIPLAWIGTGLTRKASLLHDWREREQPFDFVYKDQSDYLMDIYKDVRIFCGSIRDFKMFFISKRIIHQYSPALWLEAERREAEVRFINGLFYPALVLSVLFFLHGNIICGFALLLLSIFLILAFRRRRYAEVSFILSATYVILKERFGEK
jgi:hypothetical protein